MKRSAPAVARNREPIAEVLRDWLPQRGTVLEVASGTGEHAVFFAERFPSLLWQPSDMDPDALASIGAWHASAALPNLKPPVVMDVLADPTTQAADAILCINMVHISPWDATLGLLDIAEATLPIGGPLILYGPWFRQDDAPAPSNIAFDRQLRERNGSWGIRNVDQLAAAARQRGFETVDTRPMPANNLMLLLRRISEMR